MDIPTDLLFTKEHEWVKIEGDAGLVGITDYAQHALGDVTFVDLPKTGADVKQFKNLASVESVKAASDIFAPLSGNVIGVNARLENDPGLINRSPYQDGWIARLRIADATERSALMDAAAYKKFVEKIGH